MVGIKNSRITVCHMANVIRRVSLMSVNLHTLMSVHVFPRSVCRCMTMIITSNTLSNVANEL